MQADSHAEIQMFPMKQRMEEAPWFTMLNGPRDARMEAVAADMIHQTPAADTVVLFIGTDKRVHPLLAQVLDTHCIVQRRDVRDLELLLKEHFALLKQFEVEAGQLQLGAVDEAATRPKLHVYVDGHDFQTHLAKEWWIKYLCANGRQLNVTLTVITQTPRQIPAAERQQIDLVVVGCTDNQQVLKILYDENAPRNIDMAHFKVMTNQEGFYSVLHAGKAHIYRPQLDELAAIREQQKHRGRYESYTMLRENQAAQLQVVQRLPDSWEELQHMQMQ